jgi:hypothetical protein
MRHFRFSMTLVALACISGLATAQAAIKTKTVEYKQGGTVLEGYLAWDDEQQGKRPGVLVVHEWEARIAGCIGYPLGEPPGACGRWPGVIWGRQPSHTSSNASEIKPLAFAITRTLPQTEPHTAL